MQRRKAYLKVRLFKDQPYLCNPGTVTIAAMGDLRLQTTMR